MSKERHRGQRQSQPAKQQQNPQRLAHRSIEWCIRIPTLSETIGSNRSSEKGFGTFRRVSELYNGVNVSNAEFACKRERSAADTAGAKGRIADDRRLEPNRGRHA